MRRIPTSLPYRGTFGDARPPTLANLRLPPQPMPSRHGLRANRALGQNFVADPNTVRRIARLARVGPGDRVLEVGAGHGSFVPSLRQHNRCGH